MSAITQWFETTVGDDTVNAAAFKAGITGSTLSRQLKADALSPETIVAVARAYKADPIEGLLVARIITEHDLRFAKREALLADLTDRELADEVWRRMQEGRQVENADSIPSLHVIDFDNVAAKDSPGWRDETDQ